MLVKRMIILLSLSILVFGCAGSAKKINNLNLGMTKAEVIEAMGEPNYTSSANDVEILSYELTSNSLFSDTYFVRIKNGKVERFGQQGIFGSNY
jgi:predicted component of type VI protein secretion system